jgi:hypothetical protein
LGGHGRSTLSTGSDQICATLVVSLIHPKACFEDSRRCMGAFEFGKDDVLFGTFNKLFLRNGGCWVRLVAIVLPPSSFLPCSLHLDWKLAPVCPLAAKETSLNPFLCCLLSISDFHRRDEPGRIHATGGYQPVLRLTKGTAEMHQALSKQCIWLRNRNNKWKIAVY